VGNAGDGAGTGRAECLTGVDDFALDFPWAGLPLAGNTLRAGALPFTLFERAAGFLIGMGTNDKKSIKTTVEIIIAQMVCVL
jgi:hypothetical protein